mmetsp:Transcript_5835/g.16624  ORF Transcript_5835/g.16624 Transcript_5835/m.16624 type:complete len:276 (-) Transcript_5835:574-1401(-)|eukprot:CAMPEP_0172380276 /NCGR_PEP_ID=MMETSP1060-20121228/70357_1 /TAXON_ID=37318 /ORGANISM="Pseudo-nitzschia pungens, Strain cf. cingulata" /LENGTH=275 /DNA_ID=CAMNT_0013108029 /DNA_START=544 /DNA_END=1371 /DNA_ORIENTATION=+
MPPTNPNKEELAPRQEQGMPKEQGKQKKPPAKKAKKTSTTASKTAVATAAAAKAAATAAAATAAADTRTAADAKTAADTIAAATGTTATQVQMNPTIDIQSRTADTALTIIVQQISAMQQTFTNSMEQTQQTFAKTLQDTIPAYAHAPVPEDPEKELIIGVLAAHQAARTAGGISGFENNVALNGKEKDLLQILESFCDLPTAEELFPAGICMIPSVGRLTTKSISRLSTIRPPKCPNLHEVFISESLIQMLLTFGEWIRYQPLIGIKPTANTWL